MRPGPLNLITDVAGLLVGLYVRARVAESPVFDQAMKRLDLAQRVLGGS